MPYSGEHFFISLQKKKLSEAPLFYGLGKEYFSQFKDPPVFDSTKVGNTYAEKNCSAAVSTLLHIFPLRQRETQSAPQE
jgi:hypothetical protein